MSPDATLRRHLEPLVTAGEAPGVVYAAICGTASPGRSALRHRVRAGRRARLRTFVTGSSRGRHRLHAAR